MLFGQKERFAIEAMIEPGLQMPSSAWGRMRVWCDGKPLGDYSNPHCGLPCENFKWLRTNVTNLWLKEFDATTDINIFHRLDDAVYGYKDGVEIVDDRTLVQCRDDFSVYGHFSFLTNWGEMFDGEDKLFILCPDGINVKVLRQPFGSTDCAALSTSVAAVEEACDAFISWFELEAVRLGRPSVTKQ